MFENEPSAMPQTPAPTPGTQPVMPMQEIHTMPERFIDSGATTGGMPSAPSGGGRGRKILIVGLVVFVVGALGAGAWYYFTKLANKNANANANATVNVNRNANRNTNLNVNTNLNANANANANGNVNLNLNTNANANSNTNTSDTTTGTPLPSSTDTDGDGLTDVEEQVYGTLSNNNDSDGDGFVDGMRTLANGKIEGEVYAGYCPTKKGAVRLDDSTCGIVRSYANPTYSYALLIPKNWLAQATSSDDKTVIITPDIATAEFFQVSVLDNPTRLSARNYYLNLNPGIDASKLKDATVNGLDGVLSLDESTAYFVKGTKIYAVTYNSDALTKLNLKATFIMMYQGFHLVPETTNTNASTNTNGNTLTTNTNGNTNANATN